MARAVVLAACAALAAVALVGCGSSQALSMSEYEDVVSTTRDRVDYALAQITAGQGSLEELIDRMETAADSIDEAADDLDSSGAAKNFDDETSQLVAAFHQLASGLAGTAHDAGQAGMEGLLTGTSSLQFPGWTKANRVLSDLRNQGIDVQPIGSH